MLALVVMLLLLQQVQVQALRRRHNTGIFEACMVQEVLLPLVQDK